MFLNSFINFFKGNYLYYSPLERTIDIGLYVMEGVLLIFVVRDLIKAYRCSKNVEGTVVDVNMTSTMKGLVYYQPIFSYVFEGYRYEAPVGDFTRKQWLSGQKLKFRINPDNPMETFMFSLKTTIEMVVLMVLFFVLSCFVK